MEAASVPMLLDEVAFEPHRRRLTGLAYRMLGSVADAEDVVQEAYLRIRGVDPNDIVDLGAYLSRVVTRLCLDQLKSARARREIYVGPWLPDPILDAEAFSAESASDYALDLSVALMLALERLSPLERAAFLLHDVFDQSFDEVAAALDRTPEACRQLAARARAHVRTARPRFQVEPAEGRRIAEAFRQAAVSGDAAALSRLLAKDAVMTTDGGGKRIAALNPIHGSDRIARFFAGLARKQALMVEVHAGTINGLPGFVTVEPDGGVQTTALEIADSLVTAIHIVRNPDKLSEVARAIKKCAADD